MSAQERQQDCVEHVCCSAEMSAGSIAHPTLRLYCRMVGRVLLWHVVKCLLMWHMGGHESASSQDREYRSILHHRCEFSLADDPEGGTGCENAHEILLELWL